MARRRVLLVGDPETAAVLKDCFCYGDTYEGEPIEHCDDALVELWSRPFDLVLVLSFNAPWRTQSSLSSPALSIESSSAILFLRQIRALRQPPPVIVFSGNARSEVEVAALANGAAAFYRKPIDLTELDRLLAVAFRSPKFEEDGR